MIYARHFFSVALAFLAGVQAFLAVAKHDEGEPWKTDAIQSTLYFILAVLP